MSERKYVKFTGLAIFIDERSARGERISRIPRPRNRALHPVLRIFESRSIEWEVRRGGVLSLSRDRRTRASRT